jgi:hypothetical protein
VQRFPTATREFDRGALFTSTKERAETSLAAYVWQAWRILEPATVLAWNWHLDLICERLEAMSRGELKSLLINVPPGLIRGGTKVVRRDHLTRLAFRYSGKRPGSLRSEWCVDFRPGAARK